MIVCFKCIDYLLPSLYFSQCLVSLAVIGKNNLKKEKKCFEIFFLTWYFFKAREFSFSLVLPWSWNQLRWIAHIRICIIAYSDLRDIGLRDIIGRDVGHLLCKYVRPLTFPPTWYFLPFTYHNYLGMPGLDIYSFSGRSNPDLRGDGSSFSRAHYVV